MLSAMPRGPLKAEVAARVAAAARAARELDGHDREHLDYSTMNPDHQVPTDIRRRLIDDPHAQVYAPDVIARWREAGEHWQ